MLETNKAYCNRCGGETNHKVLAADEHEDEDWGYLYLYEMLKCRGCGTVTMRRSFVNEGEAIYDKAEEATADLERAVASIQYPAPIARRTPRWVQINFVAGEVDDNLAELMSEVYVAVQHNSRRLAAMGIRAALEMIMKGKIGECKSFKHYIDKFQEAGYLSVRDSISLDTIIEAGNASVHRGWNPTVTDVHTLLDITESVVQTAYFHESRVSELEKKLPPRKRRNPPAPDKADT